MMEPMPKARRILDELYMCEITHVVYLIGKTIRHIIEIIATEGKIALIPVCREADTFAIAAGLIAGGKRVAVMMQNTGVFESGDSIRTLGLDIQLPWLLLVGYRGWTKDKPMRDSAAILLEPTLHAWDIQTHTIETVEDAARISFIYNEARKRSKPVAALVTPEITEEN